MKMILIPVAHKVVVDKEEVMVTVMDEVAEAKGNMAEGPVLMFMSTRRQLSLVDMRCRPQLIAATSYMSAVYDKHRMCRDTPQWPGKIA